MAKQYPAAYRAAARARGIQPQRGAANDNWKPPSPANDNKALPRPANDNFPKPKSNTRALVRAGVGQFRRLVPYIGDFADLAFRYYNMQEAMPGYAFSGAYQLVPGSELCARTPEYMSFSSSNGLTPPYCLTNQTPNPVYENFDQPAPASNVNSIRMWEYTGCFLNPGVPVTLCPVPNRRWAQAAIYTRVSGVANPAPKLMNAYPFSPSIPVENVSLNPNAIPIGSGMPLQRPVPFAQAAQARVVKEKLYEWIAPSRFYPIPSTEAQPVLIPRGQIPLNAPFEMSVNVTNQKRGPAHVRRPPGRRTKERKLILSLTGAAAIPMNLVTESLDFVNALYEALPQRYRYRGKSDQQHRIEAVYRHFDKIEIDKAIKNLVVNQVQDAVIGKIGRLQARSYREMYNLYGVRGGFGVGPAM